MQRFWASAELGIQCGRGSRTGSSRGDTYGCSSGATARVGSQRAASFPAPSRGRSGAPGPQTRGGNPPVPSARVRGHGRPPEPVVSQPKASGRTALRTAAAEGQKSICSGQSWRPAPSARGSRSAALICTDSEEVSQQGLPHLPCDCTVRAPKTSTY